MQLLSHFFADKRLMDSVCFSKVQYILPKYLLESVAATLQK